MVGARTVAALAVLSILGAPRAQAQTPEAQSPEAELRTAGHAALREGRFEDALSAFQQAAFQSRDPSAWLEVGDAADRLRDDEAALDAYQRYLTLRPNGPDRAEVAARVLVLRRVLSDPGRARLAIGEAHRRGLMHARPSGEELAPARLGETQRRGIIPAAEIIDAIRRGRAGRELSAPR